MADDQAQQLMLPGLFGLSLRLNLTVSLGKTLSKSEAARVHSQRKAGQAQQHVAGPPRAWLGTVSGRPPQPLS